MSMVWCTLLIVFTAGGALAAEAPATGATTSPACPVAVEMIKAVAWPVLALLIAIVFRTPLTRFFDALGARVTKLSVFKVELELVSQARATPGVSLDDIKRMPPAQINDSSSMLFQQVQETSPADYAVIDLGGGEEWLTSRLFIAGAMLERMRGLRCLVFVESAYSVDRKLVAVASVGQLRWALARRFPWLEAAFARAYAEAQPTAGPGSLPTPALAIQQFPVVKSDTGGMEPHVARQVVSNFIASLQVPTPPQPPQVKDEWVDLETGVSERSTWVTRALLRSLLPDEAFKAWMDEAPDAPRTARTQAVFRRHTPFVALVERDNAFSQLVDRGALLEAVVARMDEQATAT